MLNLKPVSRRRRAGSLAYEGFLLGAVLFVASFVLVPIAHLFPGSVRKLVLQSALLVVAGVYSVTCWRSGHTLPMKTWGIRVQRADGGPLDTRDALWRFIAAVPSVGVFGLGLLWSLLDKDKQFLHDRLAGTRLVDASAAFEQVDNSEAGGEKQHRGKRGGD